jgi:hypothetical protein
MVMDAEPGDEGLGRSGVEVVSGMGRRIMIGTGFEAESLRGHARVRGSTVLSVLYRRDRSTRRAAGAFDYREQGAEFDGLAQVMVESRVTRPFSVLLACVPGNGD